MTYHRGVYTPNRRRRSSLWTIGCGCLLSLGALALILIAAVLILRPNLPGIAAQIAGLNPQGDTAQVFAAVTPAPTIELLNPTQPADITLNLGDYGTRQLDPNSNLYDFTLGELPAGGQSVAVATFTEAGLMEICRTQTSFCSGIDPRIRNPRLDLRPGGAVVYVDVTLPELGSVSQTAGIVLRLDATRRQFEFAGVDLNGALYSVPPDSFGINISEMEARGNELLRTLSVQAGGGYYTLSEVITDDSTLTVVLR